eukprot:gb/GFBE01001106.1/.p1 GENE.gb/GFBE01001106.1/~~gb/GFBE01001106.1/.p1  ORF type:complete len:201 (+),score=29.99 gb/GFBE01001106.1/:1-603(+)
MIYTGGIGALMLSILVPAVFYSGSSTDHTQGGGSWQTAVSGDDSTVSLLQVSGKKMNATSAQRKGVVAGSSGEQTAIPMTNSSQSLHSSDSKGMPQEQSATRQGFPLSLLSTQTFERAWTRLRHGQVPTGEGLMLTSGLLAAIIVVSVCLAVVYNGSTKQARMTSGGIPGADAEAEQGPGEAVQSNALGTTGKKSKPGCC